MRPSLAADGKRAVLGSSGTPARQKSIDSGFPRPPPTLEQ